MEPASRQRLIWLSVTVSVLLAVAQGSVWEHQHDEGTTFDLAVGIIMRGELVPSWPAYPAPITSLYETVEARTDYTVQDVVDSVTVPDYRLFHPPGYYVLVHLWTKVVGTTRLAMRLPAYLLLALSILGMARIARRVIPEANACVWVALLFSVSPWVLRITNFTRPYQLALFCAIWATVAVLSMQDEKSRCPWRLVFVALTLLGFYTLYHYSFVMIWHLALMAWQGWSARPERRRKEVVSLVAVLLALLAGFLPWQNQFFSHLTLSNNSGDYFTGSVAQDSWFGYAMRAFQDFAISDGIQTFWGSNLGLISVILGLISMPVAVWAFAGPPRKAFGAQARRFWISAALLPLMILTTDMWLGSHTILIPKLCFWMITLLVLMLVRAWLVVPWAWLRRVGLTSWVLLSVVSVAFNTYTIAAEPADMEATAARIAQTDTEDHLVILSTDLRGFSAPLLLSLRDAGVSNVFVIQAEGHDNLRSLITNNTSTQVFRRLSLVNFKIPQHKGTLMWDEEFLRRQIADPARDSKQWLVYWGDRQPWMGLRAPLGGDRVRTRFRELWLLGPVRARFYAQPIVTEEMTNAPRRPAARPRSVPGQQASDKSTRTPEGQIGRPGAGSEQPEDG